MFLKVYGVIADCPAMTSILNHISHGGYFCCWYCQTKGEHVINKRQYYYDENLQMRDSSNFAYDSKRAQYFRTNVHGRRGLSILNKILDISLPEAAIADFMHVSLLRHAKKICLYNYNKVMKPKQRSLLDKQMSIQKFPHFFHRAIRPLNETHIKASEIRNLLLYCFLPMVRNLLECERIAHIGLFVIGIRLLHGRRIFSVATAQNAHQLLKFFYRDHELFNESQQNFVLHLHIHYGELYRSHGSLCNINTFSQEDLMGAVSKYKHGSRHWVDQLAFYLNVSS
ncbi:unnamed protein product [Rotaria socialis]|nr:unnamed protein product [Rotaria socialis]